MDKFQQGPAYTLAKSVAWTALVVFTISAHVASILLLAGIANSRFALMSVCGLYLFVVAKFAQNYFKQMDMKPLNHENVLRRSAVQLFLTRVFEYMFGAENKRAEIEAVLDVLKYYLEEDVFKNVWLMTQLLLNEQEDEDLSRERYQTLKQMLFMEQRLFEAKLEAARESN